MSSSAISGLPSSLYPSSYTTSSSTRKDGFLETAAKALGMSTDDVTSALQGGSSLADLATSAGVSEDDLVSALEANAPDELKNSSDLAEMTKKMVEVKGGPGQGRGPQGPPPVPQGSSDDDSGTGSSTLELLSSMLDTDKDTLTSQLTSGTLLSDLASASGVSSDQLANVLRNGLLLDTEL